MIVEYFGLPGVGKTTLAISAENTHVVPSGHSLGKVLNTVIGLRKGARPVIALYRPFMRAPRKGARPILVILERTGRISRSQNCLDVTHLDEGTLQFIWRFFCDHELSPQNLDSMNRSLAAMLLKNRKFTYVSCVRDQHLLQIKSRQKQQPFDLSFLHGEDDYILRSRNWMAALLASLRRLGVKVHYIRVGAR